MTEPRQIPNTLRVGAELAPNKPPPYVITPYEAVGRPKRRVAQRPADLDA